LIYFGTGNPTPQIGGEIRVGKNLYTTSVVALDMATGALKWTFQLTHHDMWEMDVATPIVLYTATVNHKPFKALAAMRTDGMLFRLDRATGLPITPVEERAVKQDVRIQTWPTQPFPVGVDRFGPECVDPATAPAGFKLGCHFDPVYYDKPDVLSPLATARQAPMSYDPKSGDFFIMGVVTPYWYRRLESPAVMLLEHPPFAKEYGLYGAINGQTGRIRWQQRSAWGMASGSGALTTAGGLLFYMEGDGSLQASDANTGKRLWHFQTGAVPLAGSVSNAGGEPAATYEYRGKQYVAVSSGKLVWAFTLGGPVPERPAPPPPPTDYGFSGAVKRLSSDGSGEIAIGSYLRMRETAFDPYTFSPKRARVKAGTPFRFTNYGIQTYTVASSDGSWTTARIEPGQSATIRIEKPGSYVYSSVEFPFVKGELVVQ
jgi:alcohol dehydrogenase (cytochrome c)